MNWTFESGPSASGEGRNRTGDTTVFTRVLYRLSYLAPGRRSVAAVSGNGLQAPDQAAQDVALQKHVVRARFEHRAMQAGIGIAGEGDHADGRMVAAKSRD